MFVQQKVMIEPVIGEQLPYWFSPKLNEVLAFRPYTGKHTKLFAWFVTLTSTTPKGQTEVAMSKALLLQLRFDRESKGSIA